MSSPDVPEAAREGFKGEEGTFMICQPTAVLIVQTKGEEQQRREVVGTDYSVSLYGIWNMDGAWA